MTDQIKLATWAIECLIGARDNLARAEAAGNSRNLPGWDDLTDATVSRKAIGYLLDLGWTPPPAGDAS